MEIKIDENGFLWIKRNGFFKPQTCPYDPHSPMRNCGDWCPLFGELEDLIGDIGFSICKKTFLFSNPRREFSDERVQ